jgi:acetyl esterase
MMSPRVVRERISVEPRTYNGDTLDDQVRVLLFLEQRFGGARIYDVSPTQARTMFELSARILAPEPAPLAAVTDDTVEGADGPLPVRVYKPWGLKSEAPALVYFHGGGFVVGSLDSHDDVCRMLASTAGCVVIAVDYRLAPEHPWPKPRLDALAAFRFIAKNAAKFNISPTRIAVGGDSAGGTLSAHVAIETRGETHCPSLALLFYPAVDLTRTQPSVDGLGVGLILERKSMDWFIGHYLPAGTDARLATVSPLFTSDLSGLPPVHLQTAGFDPLRDEGFAFATRLTESNVALEHKHYGGLPHGYLQMTAAITAARPSYFDAAAALRRSFK